MAKTKPVIVLDCDLMRYPHSGLYHYCLNLGLAVQQQLEADPVAELIMYIPPGAGKEIPARIKTVTEARGWKKWFYKPPLPCAIWHAPFQSGRIIPDKAAYPATKILLTIHDLNALHENKPAAEQQKSLRHTQSLIDKADEIVCISDFCRQDVLKHCNTAGKPLRVIHNGTHQVQEPPAHPAAYYPQKPFLFGMGYVNPKKNYHVLLPLLKNESLELVIAGRLDDPGYADGIRKEATAMGVGDRLQLTGPVSEADKAWYLKHCLAFVHPSLAEGFGAPVVEAMQFGKPLFLSDRTALPEIGGDSAFYFRAFEPVHIEQVFRDGMELFHKENMANRVRQRGAFFNWQSKGAAYLDWYKSLLPG